MRIALIKTGALGDVVRTTALLPGLRRIAPRLSLTWVTAQSALDLVRHHPDVTRAVVIDDPEEVSWRHDRYDWVISLDDGLAECRLASHLAVGGARLSGGYEDASGRPRYTPDMEPWFGMGVLRPAEQGGLETANALKKQNRKTVATILYECLGLPGPIGHTAIPVPTAELAEAQTWLEETGLANHHPRIGLNTGAGGRWRFKSWGEDQTAELARRLHDEEGAAVVVLGGPTEVERNRRIVTAANRPRVLAAPTDLSLLTFTALLARCDLVVTSDSLALHLAVSQHTPVLAFFGPTSAAEIELYGLGEKLVTPLPCACCYLKDCAVRPHCMQTIKVEMFLQAYRRWRAATTITMAESRGDRGDRSPPDRNAIRSAPEEGTVPHAFRTKATS